MKLLLLVATIIAAVSARGPRWNELEGYTFDQYIRDFHKPHQVGTNAYLMRKKLFEAKLAEVTEFNQDTTRTYRKGINRMSDWTEGERRGILGNNVAMKQVVKSRPSKVHKVTGLGLPASVDYRNSNPRILTDVKDQGYCGSCWAHAATESIESHWAINKGDLFVLSQQQITSCTPNPDQCGGTGGCNGAIAELAFDYITGAGGITEEWMYSYQSYYGNTPTCAFNKSVTFPVARITGYTAVQSNDENAMADALANAGPLAISVQADTWMDYEGGVFTDCSYNITMDHAVQLVGYGKDFATGQNYWIVRNSWSPAWGEDGYIRIFRPKVTPCGWNVNNSQGAGCKGGPFAVWACGTCGIAWDAVYPNVNPN